MFPENLLSMVKFLLCSPAAVAAQTDLDGSVLDMAQDDGYDGICLIATYGDVTTACVGYLKLMGSALANGSSPVVENTTGNLTAADTTSYDQKKIVLDTRGPANRYVFSRLGRTVANAVVNDVTAILYKSRKPPVTQGTDVLASLYAWVISG